MSTATAIPDPRLTGPAGLEKQCQVMAAEGYHVIGPAVQDGAIVLRALSSTAELPFGRSVRPCDLRDRDPGPGTGAAGIAVRGAPRPAVHRGGELRVRHVHCRGPHAHLGSNPKAPHAPRR